MSSPPIQLFLTTIASAPALRQRQEYLLRILQVKKIPFVSYDLASDENAKRLWRRKAPKGSPIPGMLIGGKFPGPFEKFEEAVESGRLEAFLRLNEDYDPDLDGKVLASQPIGVPGAALPAQMQGHKPSFAPNGPTPIKKSGEAGTSDELIDAGDALPGYGFQGLKVTMNELTDLAEELGLSEKEKSDLKNTSGSSGADKSESKEPPASAQDSVTAPTEKLEQAEDKAFAGAEVNEEEPTSVLPETPVVSAEIDGKAEPKDNRETTAEVQPAVEPLKLGEAVSVEEETKPTEEEAKPTESN